jgi:uncharacterized membrane protein YphA (DoxX/SURF4 family)
MRSIAFGQSLIAIAAASLAAFSLIYGDFGPGGLFLPTWIPGLQACIAATALLLLAAGGALCFRRTAPAGALVIAAYEAVWTVLPLPQVLSDPLSLGAWYPVCEGLSALVGAWILYALLQSAPGKSSVRVAQILFGLTCVFYGWSHFVYAAYTASMVPTWLPGSMGWAYLTGAGHIAAGIGIALGILPRLAATLETIMMSLFGLLVWAPTFFERTPPQWATPPQNQWSELVVNLVLVASAYMVAISLRDRPWGFADRPRP